MSTTQSRGLTDKQKFLIRNLARGLMWLTAIVVLYVVARKYFNFSMEAVLGPVYDNPVLVYSIFLSSEVIFGIIPPEFFMIWSLRAGIVSLYIKNVISLALISYLAGAIGFFIGQYLNNTQFYKQTKKRVFGKFEKHLNNYGGFLVIVAALTPIPFSGIAMLVGSVKYSFRKYLLFSLFRFVRFTAYSIVIWEANIL